jgi:hypothetical protein
VSDVRYTPEDDQRFRDEAAREAIEQARRETERERGPRQSQ